MNIEEATIEQPIYAAEERNRHLQIAIVCAVAFLVCEFLIPTGGESLDGSYVPAGSPRMVKAVIGTTLVGIPIMASIIGALVALFPYKALPYGGRYLRAFLLSLIGIFALGAISGMIKLAQIYLFR